MKKIAAKVKKSKKKRDYDNTSREVKSEQTHAHIIENYIKLLAAKRGAEVSIDELAAAAKVSERTVFRFFKDKKALHHETDIHTQKYVQASMAHIKETNILEFAKEVFNIFERNENLVMAYMFSPFGVESRAILRQKLNKILIEQILQMKKLKINRLIETRLAVIVTIINAKLWFDIKTDFKHSSEEIGTAVSWAVDLLIKGL